MHGRYDLCTPIETAWLLHKAWPRAAYRVVDDSGHAMTEPGIVHELVTATERLQIAIVMSSAATRMGAAHRRVP